MQIVLGLVALLVLFIAVICIRAARFRPAKETPVTPVPVAVDTEKITADMVAMIQCKTVSYRDESLVDRKAFEKFEKLLFDRYPAVAEAADFKKIGKTGLLFHIKGKSDTAPSVLMAHYDVVPVDADGWEKDAFAGIVENGVIWGRGTLDTKGTLLGVMQAAESALKDGFVPENDLYLAFSGEEEIDGDTCKDIVAYLEQNGVTPALVLDEGGAVVENVFPGVKSACAVIGIAEKGSVSLDMALTSNGGHASTPPPKTVMGKLSKAVVDIESHPFPRRLTPPAAGLFDTLGRRSTFLYRLIFANLWCFMPLLDLICKLSGGELNALVRTTVAVTRMQGSNAYNVLPPKGTVGLNVRLIGGDTIDSAVEYIKKVIKNDDIAVSVVGGMNPSISSDVTSPAWQKIETAVKQTFDNTVVSPYLMMACSDSRHYCRITDKVYRFSPMRLSKEERKMIHGNNERVPVDTLADTVAFYTRLLKML